MRILVLQLMAIVALLTASNTFACNIERLNDESQIVYDNPNIRSSDDAAVCFCSEGYSLVTGGCAVWPAFQDGGELLGSYPMSQNGRPGWACMARVPNNANFVVVKVRLLCRKFGG